MFIEETYKVYTNSTDITLRISIILKEKSNILKTNSNCKNRKNITKRIENLHTQFSAKKKH